MIAALPTQEQVDQIARTLAPDVVSIRFNLSHDWSGDPAIFFHVVVADQAGRERLAEVTTRVEQKLYEGLGLSALEHISYIAYRGQSENAKLEDKAWD